MSELYSQVLKSEEVEAELSEEIKSSGFSYEEKLEIVRNLRARIICKDGALQGLLTFVSHEVVKSNNPLFHEVAFTTGEKMYFADKFFLQEIPVQCAIILHEMFHIVFRHVSRSRKRIHSLWNIATDAIINESLGFKEDESTGSTQQIYLIKEHSVNLNSLYEEFNIPSHEQRHFSQWTSEELYEFLIKKLEEDLKEELKKQQQQKGESKNKKSKSKLDEIEEDAGGISNKLRRKHSSMGGDDLKEDQGGKHASSGETDDGWAQKYNKYNKVKDQKKDKGKSENKKSKSKLDEIEKSIEEILNRLRKKHSLMGGNDLKEDQGNKDVSSGQIDDAIWTQRYNRAKAQSLNSNNSILGRVNADVYKPQIPWHKELRKYLVKRCMPSRETTWSRASRRLASLRKAGNKTYLPGIQNKKGLDKMMVIIDTSGSCFNEEELTMFCSEIQSIQESTSVELALIFADTKIRSEFIVKPDGTLLLDKIKKGWVKPEGGGGTDMVTPFIEGKKKYKPMLTVIASDGYTAFPTRSQVRGTDLIWVINTDVEVPKEAGKALYIHPREN